jgi:iron complex outermembrane recepter protein
MLVAKQYKILTTSIYNYKIIVLVLGIIFAGVCLPLNAAQPSEKIKELSLDEILDLSLEQLLNVQIQSASLTKKKKRLSPSTVSNITGKELIAMGARTLSDALKLLPGVNILERRNGRNMVWIRGIPSGHNTKIMLVVDGVPHREPVFGGWSPDEELPLNNIDHIEVIRGPGSALFGGNAYSGLISVFTLNKAKKKPEINLTLGSFNSKKVAFLAGNELATGNWLFMGSLYKTDGYDIARDRQGKATDHKNEVYSYNGNLKINVGKLKLGLSLNNYGTEYPLYSIRQSKPQDYKILTAYADYNSSLNEATWFNKAYLYRVNRKMDRRRWDQQGKLFYQSFSALDTQLLGTTSRINYQLNNHALMLGGSVELLKVNNYAEIINLRNYLAINETQSILSKDGDNSPNTVNYALFIQDDIAMFNHELGITLGLRADKYQEFDLELSPRISLVYAPNNTWTLKAMWGSAFRPPSNLQQYEVRSDGNSPGNSNLTPEQITTKELELSYRINTNQNISTRYFINSLSNFIRTVNSTPYANVLGEKSISGHEFEYVASYQPQNTYFEKIQLKSNATHINSNEASVAPNTATIQGIAELNWGSVSLAWNYVGRRNFSSSYHSRVTDLDFKAVDNKGAYSTIDMNMIVKSLWNLPLDVNFSAYNLLDEQYYNPTYAPDGYYDVTREPRYLSVGFTFRY